MTTQHRIRTLKSWSPCWLAKLGESSDYSFLLRPRPRDRVHSGSRLGLRLSISWMTIWESERRVTVSAGLLDFGGSSYYCFKAATSGGIFPAKPRPRGPTKPFMEGERWLTNTSQFQTILAHTDTHMIPLSKTKNQPKAVAKFWN